MPPRRTSRNANSPTIVQDITPSAQPSESAVYSHSTMNHPSASSSDPNPANRPELAPATALLKHAFLPLTQRDQQSDEHYVDIDALNQSLHGLFAFSIQRLDFHTGNVLDKRGHPVPADLYFRPVPPHNIQEWVNESKPFGQRYDYDPAESGYTRDYRAQTGADFFTDTIDLHLRDCEDDNNSGVMQMHTTWAYAGLPRCNLLCRTYEEHTDWTIKFVYRQSLDPTAYSCVQKINPEMPHTVITVSEGARLKDGILCNSELSNLLYFTADARVRTAKNPHSIYPVMVVVISCDTVRLSQAIWNVETGKIQIRMSPILEFPGGLWKNSTQYLTLLGWVVSDAIGKTR